MYLIQSDTETEELTDDRIHLLAECYVMVQVSSFVACSYTLWRAR